MTADKKWWRYKVRWDDHGRVHRGHVEVFRCQGGVIAVMPLTCVVGTQSRIALVLRTYLKHTWT